MPGSELEIRMAVTTGCLFPPPDHEVGTQDPSPSRCELQPEQGRQGAARCAEGPPPDPEGQARHPCAAADPEGFPGAKRGEREAKEANFPGGPNAFRRPPLTWSLGTGWEARTVTSHLSGPWETNSRGDKTLAGSRDKGGAFRAFLSPPAPVPQPGRKP